MELSMDLWHLNHMKVVTLTYSWLSLIRISVILTNLKSPWNFLKKLLNFLNFLNFLPVTLSNSNGFSSLFGKILSVIQTSPHFWQVNWPLPLSNGLSIFHLFFQMFWFLIQTSFKHVNKSPWYIERWWRGILNKKKDKKKEMVVSSFHSLSNSNLNLPPWDRSN